MGTLSETLKAIRRPKYKLFQFQIDRRGSERLARGVVWRVAPLEPGFLKAHHGVSKNRPQGGHQEEGPKGHFQCLCHVYQDQIQEFKEAFNMIDQNRDGFIDHDDLKDMLASLGKDVSDDYLDEMMNQAPGAINFTMFLTLFGERLQGT